MKKIKSAAFFLVAILVCALAYTAFFGIYTEYGDIETTVIKGARDISLGMEFTGGMDITFAAPENIRLTDEELQHSAAVIERRLVNMGILDYEILIDYENSHISVRFLWKGSRFTKADEIIHNLGAAAQIVFREGRERGEDNLPTGVTATNIILTNEDIASAIPTSRYGSTGQIEYAVELTLTNSGKKKLEEATFELLGGSLSIWLDDTMISTQTITATVTDGRVIIPAGTAADDAITLASQANSGALPCTFKAISVGVVGPEQGNISDSGLIIASIAGLAIICVFMILKYKAVGVASAIALVGQLSFTIGFISGYFKVFNSFTLTLSGVVAILLSFLIGANVNVVIAERIKAELQKGKSLQNAISTSFEKSLPVTLDSFVPEVLIAVVLAGAFTSNNNFFAKILKPLFFAFDAMAIGAIYTFGVTLLMGLLGVLIMNVLANRVMIRSLSQIKAFENPQLYGGLKNEDK